MVLDGKKLSDIPPVRKGKKGQPGKQVFELVKEAIGDKIVMEGNETQIDGDTLVGGIRGEIDSVALGWQAIKNRIQKRIDAISEPQKESEEP